MQAEIRLTKKDKKIFRKCIQVTPSIFESLTSKKIQLLDKQLIGTLEDRGKVQSINALIYCNRNEKIRPMYFIYYPYHWHLYSCFSLEKVSKIVNALKLQFECSIIQPPTDQIADELKQKVENLKITIKGRGKVKA